MLLHEKIILKFGYYNKITTLSILKLKNRAVNTKNKKKNKKFAFFNYSNNVIVIDNDCWSLLKWLFDN